MHNRRCKWLGRDEHGRPFCEHGPARKDRDSWACVFKVYERQKRYRATAKGKAFRRRENATEHARSSKALYNLTRTPGLDRLTRAR